MSSHALSGTQLEIFAPRSQFYHGPYGRMFWNLPPWEPDGQTEADKIERIHRLAEETFVEADENNNTLDNPDISAAYTYLGQFIDHDITFDPTSSLQRKNDPNRLRNFRTPRFDLDSVYGRGPDAQPYLYTRGKPGQMLIGSNQRREADLPRNQDDSLDASSTDPLNLLLDMKRTALIGDPRNDENIIVSQLHLSFLKFHNRCIMDGLSFEEAQRSTRWHYQWVVIHDFLELLCGRNFVKELLTSGADPGRPNLHFYDFKDQPFMPVEFSVAAYRIGHSMVRPSYHLNDRLTCLNEGRPFDIFSTASQQPSNGDGPPPPNLSGGRALPPLWTIQWNRFVRHNDSDPQKSRRIDTKISSPLKNLPLEVSDKRYKSLPFRNLLRGWRMGLPSGQAVAERMMITTSLPGNDPLWIYILKEAAAQGDGGKKLGPVGKRIVGEVFVGLLAGDPQSYYSVSPMWQPEVVQSGESFTLRDFLLYAGMPMTQEDIRRAGVRV